MKKNNLRVTVGKFLNKHGATFFTMAMMFAFMGSTVFATSTPAGSAAPADANALWNTVADVIQTWVTRLGGVVCFVGGIMFAMGWKSDDAEQKSRGISTLVAGAMVMVIAGLAKTVFFK